MNPFRALVLRHRRLAALTIALALCMKALLPVGYMVGTEGKQLTIEICDGQGGHVLSQLVLPSDGKTAPAGHHHDANTCPFSSLSMGAMASADAVLLLAAIAFVLALGFAPLTQPPLPRIRFLSPPLRGPPLLS